jgi:flavin-binding protein dodecin
LSTPSIATIIDRSESEDERAVVLSPALGLALAAKFRSTRFGVQIRRLQEGNPMADSVYKVIELVGTSTESWEKAARAAVERASQSLRDLRVAEIVELDMQITDGKIEAYRAKVKVSFKFEEQQ